MMEGRRTHQRCELPGKGRGSGKCNKAEVSKRFPKDRAVQQESIPFMRTIADAIKMEQKELPWWCTLVIVQKSSGDRGRRITSFNTARL